jgi:peptidoglycan hydrolase-like protein with peptidoglycan-binding domain
VQNKVSQNSKPIAIVSAIATVFMIITIKSLDSSAQTIMPSHAVPAWSGRGWICEKGFYQVGAECSPVVAPPHATLDWTGHGWVCEGGYYQVGSECLAVQIPEHAVLDWTGHRWTCERGYYQVRSECAPVAVPPHATLDWTGHGWVCERGHYQIGAECLAVQIPARAVLDWTGHGWTCERGYYQSGPECLPVEAPAHATVDWTGHAWTCQPGFIRIENNCLVPNSPISTAPSLAPPGPATQSPQILQTPTPSRAAQAAPNDYAEPEKQSEQSQLTRAQILEIQSGLNDLGINVGEPDGLPGSKTARGIRRFQRQNALTADGKPSLELRDRIDRAIRIKASLGARESTPTETVTKPTLGRERAPTETVTKPTFKAESKSDATPAFKPAPPVLGSPVTPQPTDITPSGVLVSILCILLVVLIVAMQGIPYLIKKGFALGRVSRPEMPRSIDVPAVAAEAISPRPPDISPEVLPKKSIRVEVDADKLPTKSATASLRVEPTVELETARPVSTPSRTLPPRRRPRGRIARPVGKLATATASTPTPMRRPRRGIKKIFSIEEVASDVWMCGNCHANNPLLSTNCEVCHHPK